MPGMMGGMMPGAPHGKPIPSLPRVLASKLFGATSFYVYTMPEQDLETGIVARRKAKTGS